MAASIAILPIFILMICLCLVIPILMGIYVYRDASGRGMNAALWTLLCLLAPGFIGLIIYLIVRSEHNDLRCRACSKPVKTSFAVCPYCGASLKEHCPNCGFTLQPEWFNCPDCGEIIPIELRGDDKSVKKKDKGLKWLLIAVIIIPLALCVLMFLALCGFTAVGGSYSSASSTLMSADYRDEVHSEYINSWIDECDAAGPGAYILRAEEKSYFESDEVVTAFLLYCNNGYSVDYVTSHMGGWFTDATAEFHCAPGNDDNTDAVFAYYEYISEEPCNAEVLIDGKKINAVIKETNIADFSGLSSYCTNEITVDVYVDENAVDVFAVECCFNGNDGISSSEFGQLADGGSAAGEVFTFFYDISQDDTVTSASVIIYDENGGKLASTQIDFEECPICSIIIEVADDSTYNFNY